MSLSIDEVPKENFVPAVFPKDKASRAEAEEKGLVWVLDEGWENDPGILQDNGGASGKPRNGYGLVVLNRAANVRLLDDVNLEAYRTNGKYMYYGDYARKFPINLRPPSAGKWHLVIDLGKESGNIQASVKLIKNFKL